MLQQCYTRLKNVRKTKVYHHFYFQIPCETRFKKVSLYAVNLIPFFNNFESFYGDFCLLNLFRHRCCSNNFDSTNAQVFTSFRRCGTRWATTRPLRASLGRFYSEEGVGLQQGFPRIYVQVWSLYDGASRWFNIFLLSSKCCLMNVLIGPKIILSF